MKTVIAYFFALGLSLFNGKLVAGAISGILLTPIAKPFESFSWVSRYAVPFIQGLAMGGVAVSTAKWVLSWFDFSMGWGTIGLLIIGFVIIATTLVKKAEGRSFHVSAGLGEILGISLSGYYLLVMRVAGG